MVGRGRQTTGLFKHDKTGWAKDAGDGLHMDLLLLGHPRQDNEAASPCRALHQGLTMVTGTRLSEGVGPSGWRVGDGGEPNHSGWYRSPSSTNS